jgi:phosphoribosylanthranilate isomerase
MARLKIKICGMTEAANIAAVAKLEPDYMGFILYKGSSRYVSLEACLCLVRHIPKKIKKVGVLVNESPGNALEIASSGAFDYLQLHGNESPAYCEELHHHIRLIKSFSVSDRISSEIPDYEPFCSMFIFDSAGEKHGGNGKKFDHSALADYRYRTEFLLSGGISPSDSEYVKSAVIPGMAGVDLNSRFELKPGVKDIQLLKIFMENLRKDD